MTKRDKMQQQLDELRGTVEEIETAFDQNDLNEAIVQGARATVALRDLRDAAAKSRFTDIRDEATELKTRVRTAMLEGSK